MCTKEQKYIVCLHVLYTYQEVEEAEVGGRRACDLRVLLLKRLQRFYSLKQKMVRLQDSNRAHGKQYTRMFTKLSLSFSQSS